jgi:hypothetical protein
MGLEFKTNGFICFAFFKYIWFLRICKYLGTVVIVIVW